MVCECRIGDGMRDDIWLVLTEDGNGGIGVQAFDKDPVESYVNMNGVIGDSPSRATLIHLAFKKRQVMAMSKDLPVGLGDKPDGWMLGEGPVYFKKEEKDEQKG